MEPKELPDEIVISSDGGGISKQSPNPSTKESANTKKKKKTKSFHPPIENHWQLPPIKEPNKSHLSFMSMLSQPLKYMESFRNTKRSQSTKMVLEGTHNPKDEKIVDSLRNSLLVEGQLLGKHSDYHTLLRFLRMRDFDVVKAKDMFMQYIKWREEFGVDAISKEFKYDEYVEVKKCYPHGYHGVDRYGHPVYIERIGMVDLDTFLRISSIEIFVKYHVCEQERSMKWRYPACSLAAKKHIASTLSILDVKDVGMNQFSKPARYLFMEIQKIDSCYYPETLHQLFIINAGSGFKILWKAIRAFLDARTLAKIRVLGTDYKSSLIEAIDPSDLPTFLGGDCTCSESGGCLFSDKGPWNDRDITQMLQGMLYDEESENGHNEKRVFSGEEENVTSPAENEIVSDANGRKCVDKALLEKIQAFEPVLEDAKEKIKMLETALKETKFVLQGLAQHIEELKR